MSQVAEEYTKEALSWAAGFGTLAAHFSGPTAFRNPAIRVVATDLVRHDSVTSVPRGFVRGDPAVVLCLTAAWIELPLAVDDVDFRVA